MSRMRHYASTSTGPSRSRSQRARIRNYASTSRLPWRSTNRMARILHYVSTPTKPWRSANRITCIQHYVSTSTELCVSRTKWRAYGSTRRCRGNRDAARTASRRRQDHRVAGTGWPKYGTTPRRRPYRCVARTGWRLYGTTLGQTTVAWIESDGAHTTLRLDVEWTVAKSGRYA